MYTWEAHMAEPSFRGCKGLGHFNARGVIHDIKRVNASVESSTTLVEFHEWMSIGVLTRSRWEKVDLVKCKNDEASKI